MCLLASATALVKKLVLSGGRNPTTLPFWSCNGVVFMPDLRQCVEVDTVLDCRVEQDEDVVFEWWDEWKQGIEGVPEDVRNQASILNFWCGFVLLSNATMCVLH